MRYRCGYKEDNGKTSFVTSWSTSSSFDDLSFPSGNSFFLGESNEQMIHLRDGVSKGARTKRQQYLISFPTGMVEEICFLFLILKTETKKHTFVLPSYCHLLYKMFKLWIFWKWVEKRHVVPNLAFVLRY